ncbi:efflux transporter outer membrane subunit [Martelella sp. HB161492]|uniref:efflux transporter outer membrane subunit n=1 Tax=Martelella sp. HB161492 TaxID=2720726 RepID=UPI0015913ECB|nr:efflux transporter outer membrane subunit [Martelella sp. HB161492]
MLLRRVSVPFVMLLLSGCVVGPDYQKPDMPLPTKFSEGSTKSDGDVTQTAWWTSFNDSQLNAYVDKGLAQNLDILQAVEAIAQAQEGIITATAGAYPSVDLTGSDAVGSSAGEAASTSAHKLTNTATGSIPVSWYLDLFGKYKRAGEAAEAQLGQAYASADVARLALISNLVQAYVNARLYQERLQIAKSNLASRRETLKLTQFQLDAGASSRLDVAQSEGLVNAQLSSIPGLEASYRAQVYSLSTLMGLPAATLIDQMNKKKPIPMTSATYASGVPADLIRNRPDIRKAEQALAAATANIGVSEAALYPSITLSGTVTASLSASHLAGSNGLTSWSFGPALSLPIFDGGALRANVRINESQARAAYLAWQQTVLDAISEVETALAKVSRDGRTVSALRATVASYKEALDLSTASYKDGATSLLDVLDAQRSVSSAEADLADAVASMANDYVSLNVAIGGGYAVGSK